MLKLRRTQPNARPEQPFQYEYPKGYTHRRWLEAFDDLDTGICRQLNILIENFPDRYNPASVLQIDMFNTSEEKLQDQLTKTMSVVFEGVAEMGGQSAENRRLTYAWRLRHLMDYNAHRQKLMADVLYILVLVFTFLTTVAAIVYGFYYAQVDSCGNNDELKLPLAILGKLNLLLPLVATILRGILAALNPMAKYSVLKLASIKIESEIYLYRTKVGKYNVRKAQQASDNAASNNNKGNGNNQQKNKKDETAVTVKALNPRKIFSSAMENIWFELGASDIKKDALVKPPQYEDPLDEINDRIRNNVEYQHLFTKSLRPPTKALKETVKSNENSGTTTKGTTNGDQGSAVDNSIDVEKGIEITDIYRNRSDSKDSNMSGYSYNSEKPSGNDAASVVGSVVGSVTNTNENIGKVFSKADVKQSKEEEMLDDGLSTLTADEYVRIRIYPVLASFLEKVPTFSNRVNTISVIVIGLSVTSAVFSAFDLVLWIPVAMAVSAFLTSWQSFSSVDTRLGQTNAAINQLNQLMIWWDSLTMIEKRVGANKEFLVMTTETAVQGQVVTTFTVTTNQDDDKGDEKD
jgi:hypothetical protein